MALLAWQATVQDQAGNAVVNPSVTVRNAVDNSLADIFADEDGLTPLANPFTGTSQGFVKFFAAYGRYNIEGALGAETTATWEVQLEDWTGRAEAAAEQAEAEVSSAAVRFYDSVADFQAATIPALVNVIGVVNADGEMIFYRREPGAVGEYDLLHIIQNENWAKSSVMGAEITAAIDDAVSAAEFPIVTSGTFDPTVTFATPGTLAVVYGAVRRGRYIRIGNWVRVTIQFNTVTITKGTASGRLRIGFDALPFTPNALGLGSGQLRFVNSLVTGATLPSSRPLVYPGLKYIEIGAISTTGGYTFLETANIADGAVRLDVVFEFEV